MLMKEIDALFTDPSKRTITKSETRRRSLDGKSAYIECKATSPTSKNGTIEGYASVWDVIDAQGEVVRRGAYTKTINERGAKLPLMVSHFRDGGDVMSAVGGIVELKEDDYGLWFKASFFSDELAQKVRERCKELAEMDVKLGSSVGYKIINYGFTKDEETGRTHMELRELALKEITVTLRPANKYALVTAAKTADDVCEILPALKPIADADVDKMTADEKNALVVSVFGDKAKAESLGKALKGIADKTLGLLPQEPQPAANSDGASGSEDPSVGTDKGETGKNANTESAVEQNSGRRVVESARLLLAQLEAETD